MQLRSLKSKLLAGVSVLVICSGLLISLWVIHRYNRSLLDSLASQAQYLARAVSLQAADMVLINHLVALQKMLDHQLRSNPNLSYLFVNQGRSAFRQLIELVELGLEHFLVGQDGLVFGDERRREGAAEGVLHHFAVPGGAEQHTDGRALVGFFDVPVQGLQVELELPQVLWLEAAHLQLDSDQAAQSPMKEEEVEGEIPPSDLEGVFRADEAEIAPQFEDKSLQLPHQTTMQVRREGPGIR
jgi:hypothetical protein